MTKHLSILANLLRLIGAAVTLPALGVLAYSCWFLLSSQPHTAPAGTDAQDGLVWLMTLGARAVGSVFDLANQATRWLAEIVSTVALSVSLFGAGLFFTGRGLLRHATWARILAGVLVFGVLALSLGAILLLGSRGAAVVFAPAVGFCVYSLWVLALRF